MSNRLSLIDREYINPLIHGVDFGGKTHVIARSDDAVLMWVSGHSYWSGTGQPWNYAGSSLILLPDRRYHGNLKYKHVHDGGRLSAAVISKSWAKIEPSFGEDVKLDIINAVNRGKTLLIEGGGPQLMPPRFHGADAYKRWRDLPEESRGFHVGGDNTPARLRHKLGYKEP